MKRSIRIGLYRRSQYRPVASVRVSADGGIMIAPVAVGDQGWKYGTSRTAESVTPSDFTATDERPKLHYHRSGIASVTLTGHELERKRLRLPPLESVALGQIMSLVVVRPWELGLGVSRRGDIGTIHAQWPETESWLFQLVRYEGALIGSRAEELKSWPVGVLRGDDSRWFIDLSWYIPNTALVVLTAPTREPSGFLQASITVTALGWSPDRSAAARDGVLALWTSDLRNPLVAHAKAEDLLSGEQLLSRARAGELLFESIDEATDRIYGRPNGDSR